MIAAIIIMIAGLYLFGKMLPSNPAYEISASDKFIVIDGNKIRYKYLKRDSDITIVFLHSFGSKLEMWNSLSSYFVDQNLLLYDMVGFGKSDKPDINYSIDVQSRYLMKMLDSLGIKSCYIIGSSMGASTAAWAGSKYPGKIKKLVLFAPSGYPGSMNHKFPGNFFYKPGILNMIGNYITSSRLFKLFFPNSLGQQTFSVTASYSNLYVNVLNKITQPTLLIWSKGDTRSNFDYASKYLSIIKDSKLIEKPKEAGHSCPNFRSKETAEEIISYFESIDLNFKHNKH
ncbi:MAG: alpha/beta hydrolase [Ignavibacterium sp.]|jgi:pimeloyl-ACP methyl ester carboxylesterase|nr:alpha/beta hydrolase [Ignavibacterium sp.]